MGFYFKEILLFDELKINMIKVLKKERSDEND